MDQCIAGAGGICFECWGAPGLRSGKACGLKGGVDTTREWEILLQGEPVGGI
jgi:hypothetical protein